MQARLEVIGIVVSDMARALTFYRRLGLEAPPGAEQEPHVEIALPGGLRLAFDTVETMGVPALEGSLGSYRAGLGLPPEGMVGTEFPGGAVVFFRLRGGLILALFPKEELAKDANLPPREPNPAAFSVGHNVGSREEVDQVLRHAAAA